MTEQPDLPQDRPTPPRSSLGDLGPMELLVRRAKVVGLSAQRLWRWASEPAAWPAAQVCTDERLFPHLLWEQCVPIRRPVDHAARVLEDGKRVNLALAAPAFDGLVVTTERPLSYWRALGRVTAQRGFRHGIELRGGCIVPALGGGLCLLSNALFRAAVELGWTIIERHGHSQEAVPPLPGELWGLDATVSWPYVDLRVSPPGPVWLRVAVLGDELRLRVLGAQPSLVRATLHVQDERVEELYPGERVRHNRILRRLWDAGRGRLLAEEVVAVNRARLLHAHEQQRNCLTCAEEGCHARSDLVRHLPVLR